MRPTSPTPSRTCGRRGRPCRRRSSPTPRRSPGSTSASPATSCGIARPPPPVAAGRSTSAASEQPHDRCSRPVQVSRCLSDNRRYGLYGAGRLCHVTLTWHHWNKHGIGRSHCDSSRPVAEAGGVYHHHLRLLGYAVNEMGEARLVCLVVAGEGWPFIEAACPTREAAGRVSVQGRYVHAVGHQGADDELSQGRLARAAFRAGYGDDRHDSAFVRPAPNVNTYCVKRPSLCVNVS